MKSCDAEVEAAATPSELQILADDVDGGAAAQLIATSRPALRRALAPLRGPLAELVRSEPSSSIVALQGGCRIQLPSL